MSGYGGEVQLHVARRGDRSIATKQFHRGALRVVRPYYLDGDGTVTYTLVNPGGGFLGADSYSVGVTLDKGTRLRLLSQSATKIYRTPEAPARQEQRFVLGEGAYLESLPQPVIVYRQGTFIQRTTVEMHPGSSLCSAEIITPGWAPDGSQFGWDELRVDTEVWMQGQPIVLDRLRLVPHEGVTGVGAMEGNTHSGTVIIVGAQVTREELRAIVREFDSCTGIGQVPGGLVVRSLGDSSGVLRAMHLRIAEYVRGYGVDLREV